MANWLPSQVSPDANYITLLDTLAARDEDAAQMAINPTNPSVGYIRFVRTTGQGNFEQWIGSGWQSIPLSVAGGGTGSTTPGGAVSSLGLGTMALQNNNAVNITGGTITGLSNLIANAATIGSLNVVSQTISSSNPSLYFTETDAPVDQKSWLLYVQSTGFRLTSVTDALAGILDLLAIDRAGNTTIAGNLTITGNVKSIGGGFYTPDGVTFAITIQNTALYFSGNEQHFRTSSNLSYFPLIDFYHTSAAPATHPGGRLWFNGGYGSPVAGKTIIGDGSGWVWHVSKKSAGVITDLFEFNDSGQHRVDWLKSLNSTYITFEAFSAGGFQYKFFDTGTTDAVIAYPSTLRVNVVRAWSSFTLSLEGFTEGGINFMLSGARIATLYNGQFYIDKITNHSANTITFNATGTGPLLAFQINGAPALSITEFTTFCAKPLGLGGTVYSGYSGVQNDLNLGAISVWTPAPGAPVEVTGIAGGFTGRVLIVHCWGNSMIFKHDDARSAAANRFYTRGFVDFTMNFSDAAIFVWSSIHGRWLVTATNI